MKNKKILFYGFIVITALLVIVILYFSNVFHFKDNLQTTNTSQIEEESITYQEPPSNTVEETEEITEETETTTEEMETTIEEMETTIEETETTGTDTSIDEIVNSLTLEEKVAQMFFVTPESITGAETVIQAGRTTKDAFVKYPVGGLVYFAPNLISGEQTKEMLSNVQNYALERLSLPVFLGVDEEGGRVLRIGNNPDFHVEKVEAMGILAEAGDNDVIYDAGNTIGAYLADLGFNVDFAPDADVLSNADNEVIGDRSFGTNPDIVAEMAWAYTEGLHHNGVLASYKHFPGHGGTVEDSHSEYAYSYKTLEELKVMELVPFQSGSEKGVDFIMVSHISTPEVTGSDIPASLSELWITDILRNDMGYEGIIITDSLSMGAISNHYEAGEAAVMAVNAGCDMLLMPSDFETAYKAVLNAVKDETISQEQIDQTLRRIIKAKLKLITEE